MIELTRRCNLNCKHCMRGDAQNIDISYDVLDKVFDNMNGVQKLSFTGGEPFLAKDKMIYILNKIMENNIIICEFSVITNGTIIDEEITDTYKRFFYYMKNWYERIYNKEFSDNYIKAHIEVGISSDKYHETKHDELYNNMVSMIGNYSGVKLYSRGNQVKEIGRAKQLLNCGAAPDDLGLRRIEVYGKNLPCYCRMVNERMMKNQPDNITIMCPVQISAKGILSHTLEMEFETEDLEKYKVFDFKNDTDIIACIEKYNADKMLCFRAERILDVKKEKRIENDDIEIKANDILYDYENALNDKLEETDEKYFPAFKEISEDEQYAQYDGETRTEQIADYLKKNEQRPISDIEADIIFRFDSNSKYRKIKKLYPKLNIDECIRYYYAQEQEKEQLRLKNCMREAYSELAHSISNNKRNIHIYKEYKYLIDNKLNGDYEKAYEIYTQTTAKNQTLSLEVDEKTKEQLNSFESFKLCVDELNDKEYGIFERWNATLAFFSSKMENIIKHFEMDDILWQKDKGTSIEEVKDILRKKMSYAMCWNQIRNCNIYKNFYNAEKNKGLCMYLDLISPVILEAHQIILGYKPILMSFVNQIDDLCKKSHTYSEKDLAQEMFKNIFGAFKVNKVLREIENYNKYLRKEGK